MKTRKLIKEPGMRTDVFIREMSRIVAKRASCSILWIGKRYAVYSDNSRNENIGHLTVG
jgi:acyl-coenzyme A synthetase/AMP-(fatty) acid ligase